MTPEYITNIETGQIMKMSCRANAVTRCERDPRWVIGKYEIEVEPVEPVEPPKPKRKPGRPKKAKVEEPKNEQAAAEPEVDGGIDL